MQSKEEKEKIKRRLIEELGRTITVNEYGLFTNDFSESIETLESALKYIEQLETREQKLIEKLEEKEKLNDKYLQKLVYALSPTTHALGDSYNNAFKSIIADKIDLETCKIKRELKDCWEGRF